VAENSTQLRPDSSFDFEGAVQSFINEFGESKIGAALFDSSHRLLAINKTLAEMNRRSVEAHSGKTLGEIVNEKCCEASSIIPRVFETGISAHAEITAKLATRQDEATWAVTFIPVKDTAGKVVLVTTLVVETTKSKVHAEVLRTLLTVLPQVRDKVSGTYVISQTRKKPIDPMDLVRAAELAEQCVDAIQRFADTLQLSEALSLGLPAEDADQHVLPFDSQNGNGEPPHQELLDSKLAKRELEVVRLLAEGKCSKEISDQLSITLSTVQSYRKQIMAKLGTDSIADITRFAVRNNLVKP
jgi:DNA-binding CsgD family transcriptional regulator